MENKEYMKRYWLFIYEQYYPQGGMCDFKESYDSLVEASEAGKKEIIQNTYYQSGWYWHIYDSKINSISIFSTDNTRYGNTVEIFNTPIDFINEINFDI